MISCFLDEPPHALGLVVEAGPIEVPDDGSLATLHQGLVEAGLALLLTVFVDATTEEAEQRRLHGRPAPFRRSVSFGGGGAGRQEGHDLPGQRLGHEVIRPLVADGLQRLLRPHGQQPHAVAPQRGDGRTPSLEIGEKVLPEGHHHLVGHGLEVQAELAGRAVLEAVRHSRGDAVLDEVGQILAKGGDLGGHHAPEGEQFLELIEDEHRPHQAVLPRPELLPAPVEVLPGRFAVRRGGMLNLLCVQRVEQGQANLLDERLGSGSDLQPQEDREETLLSQPGEDPGLQE